MRRLNPPPPLREHDGLIVTRLPNAVDLYLVDRRELEKGDLHAALIGRIGMSPVDIAGCPPDLLEVTRVVAQEGYGPHLYDAALEVAEVSGRRLVPDRFSVSDEAASVWYHYRVRRPDVQHEPSKCPGHHNVILDSAYSPGPTFRRRWVDGVEEVAESGPYVIGLSKNLLSWWDKDRERAFQSIVALTLEGAQRWAAWVGSRPEMEVVMTRPMVTTARNPKGRTMARRSNPRRKAAPIKITIATQVGTPVTTLDGFQLTDHIAMHELSGRRGWKLTHLPTGLGIGAAPTKVWAGQLANELERMGGELMALDHQSSLEPELLNRYPEIGWYLNYNAAQKRKPAKKREKFLTYDQWRRAGSPKRNPADLSDAADELIRQMTHLVSAVDSVAETLQRRLPPERNPAGGFASRRGRADNPAPRRRRLKNGLLR